MKRRPTIRIGDHWYIALGFSNVEKVVIHDITEKTVAVYTPLPAGKTPQIDRYKTEHVEWVELIKAAGEATDGKKV